MFFKTVLGPASGCTYHEAVTGVLGEDGCRHYRGLGGIALYYGLAEDVDIRAFVAVHKKDIGFDAFGFKLLFYKQIGSFHGKKRGLKDVDGIDLGRRAPGYGPGD